MKIFLKFLLLITLFVGCTSPQEQYATQMATALCERRVRCCTYDQWADLKFNFANKEHCILVMKKEFSEEYAKGVDETYAQQCADRWKTDACADSIGPGAFRVEFCEKRLLSNKPNRTANIGEPCKKDLDCLVARVCKEGVCKEQAFVCDHI